MNTTRAMLWRYVVPEAEDQAARDAVFTRMQAQGLLPSAMSAISEPTLEAWRELTAPHRAWLVCAQTLEPQPELLGAALLTPWRHRVWEFDFTVFRPHFALAPLLARGVQAWAWEHAPCDSLMGLCPAPNRHAWRLAEAAGFTVLGRVPGACFVARGRQGQGKYVDGVLVCAQRFTPSPTQATVYGS